MRTSAAQRREVASVQEITPCIDEDMLVALSCGALTEADRLAAFAHLDDCAWCRALVREVVGEARTAVAIERGGEVHAVHDYESDASVDAAPVPGDRIGGRFVLGHPLGVGSHGVVWAAWDEQYRAHVAVKMLRTSDSALARRLMREASGLGELVHPNIVRVLGTLATAGRPAIVMELLAGETLQSRIQRQLLAPAEACALALGASRGLAAAHARGVIHRDLKPANVMICSDGAIKLLDFGLADWAEAGLFTIGLTRTGMLVGTPSYMAPELLMGDLKPHRGADVWSLGAMLYEALCGRPPYGHQPVGRLVNMALQGGPAPLASVNPNVPAPLAALVDAMLIVDPAHRLGDVRVVEAAIGRAFPS